MTRQLPPVMVDGVQALPVFRMGAHRLSVRHQDGRTVDDLFVSGRQVTKALGNYEVRFDTVYIITVRDHPEAPLPPGLLGLRALSTDQSGSPFRRRRWSCLNSG